jgi:hypothetical protein
MVVEVAIPHYASNVRCRNDLSNVSYCEISLSEVNQTVQDESGTNVQLWSRYQLAQPIEKELIPRVANETIETFHNLIGFYLQIEPHYNALEVLRQMASGLQSFR